MAATYPLDVAEAARWRQDPQNAALKGDQLFAALQQKSWDPSVKFPTHVANAGQLQAVELRAPISSRSTAACVDPENWYIYLLLESFDRPRIPALAADRPHRIFS
jgi:hypothetical protein